MALTTTEKPIPYCEGRDCYWNWGSSSDCPYGAEDARRCDWFKGWFDAAETGGTL